MRSFTEKIPRYLDWFQGLSQKTQRGTFKSIWYTLKKASIKDVELAPWNGEKCVMERGFIAMNWLDYVRHPTKLQRCDDIDIIDMLVAFTPVLMKFGVVPCNFLKSKVGDLDPQVVYVESKFPQLEEIEPEVMQKIIEEADQLLFNYSARKLASQKKTSEDQSKFLCLQFSSLCYWFVIVFFGICC